MKSVVVQRHSNLYWFSIAPLSSYKFLLLSPIPMEKLSLHTNHEPAFTRVQQSAPPCWEWQAIFAVGSTVLIVYYKIAHTTAELEWQNFG